MKRLPAVPGEWIDRQTRFDFVFEGRSYSGFKGDVIASALAASGRYLLGRSFKYHRPRGPLSFANHDVNVMVQDGERLNLRADVVPLEQGLRLNAVNTFGGLDRDRARFLGWISRLLPVGFYYKAFHQKRWFPMWERLFRRLTGLGVVAPSTPRLRTAKRYDYCDVLVIGAGPSGLSAALAAADCGAQVALADENSHQGGSGLFNLGGDAAQSAQMRELVARVEAHPRIRLYAGCVAAGYYTDHWVPLVERERITKMRARAVICATGAFEQPAVFRNNDLPGVMLASAAQRLIYRYAVGPGNLAVVLAANADAYRAALDLLDHGIKVAALLDLRPLGEPSALAAALVRRGVELVNRCGVYEALARKGRLAAVRIAPLRADGELEPAQGRVLACDLLLMGTGWSPALNLLYQAGAKVRFDELLSQFVPAQLPAGLYACGRVNGIYSHAGKLLDGQRSGCLAAAGLGFAAPQCEAPPAETQRPSHPYPIFAHPQGKNFLDFDEDLQLQDFFNAAQEGYDNIELLKRYSTVGMGPSQGKHSNMNAIRVLAKIRGLPVERIGSTTARPMFHPVPMAHLAGRAFQVERETPLQAQHAALGACFMAAGQWQRPEYYARPGLTRLAAIQAEVTAVRDAVGLIDVGTLGKIELHGPDAGLFLERVYTGRFARMKPGSTRYGLMLDESGVVIDDGVIARLGEEHYYFTTTTSGSATVYRELVRLNTMWQLRVGIVNLTGHLGALNLAGPRARQVLGKLTAMDLSDAAFPYLAARGGRVAGVDACLLRVGFVGELGYEIHAPAQQVSHLWESLMQAGAPCGIQPFGVEAQRLLRLEKGHLIVGQDTDGLTNPYEASADWAVAMDKPYFIGQRSLRAIAGRPLRQKLVGFRLSDAAGPRPQESHLLIAGGEIAGRVTSTGWSPTLQCVIGLAFVAPTLADEGTEISIRLGDGALVKAVVSRPPFYDAGNLRQKLAEAA